MGPLFGILIFIAVIVFLEELFAKLALYVKPLFIFIGNNYLILLACFVFIGAIFFIRLYQTSPKNHKITKKELLHFKNEVVIMSEGIDETCLSKQDLKPIDDLDIQRFAQQAATFFNDPKRYTDFLTGWWHRWGVERASKAIDSLNNYLVKLREASDNASQLQEAIIKNRVIFQYQAQFALQRLKDDWDIEKKQKELQKIELETQKVRQEFYKKFYETIDVSKLSDDERIIFLSQQPIAFSSSFSTSNISNSSSVQYVNPSDLLQLKQQERMLEIYWKQKTVELDHIEAGTDRLKQQARQDKAQADLDEHTAKITIRDTKNS